MLIDCLNPNIVEPEGTVTGTQTVADCPFVNVLFSTFPADVKAVVIPVCPKAAVVAVIDVGVQVAVAQVVQPATVLSYTQT